MRSLLCEVISVSTTVSRGSSSTCHRQTPGNYGKSGSERRTGDGEGEGGSCGSGASEWGARETSAIVVLIINNREQDGDGRRVGSLRDNELLSHCLS